MGKQTIEAATNEAKTLSAWKESVLQFRESVVQNLGQIGESWGQLQGDQTGALEDLTITSKFTCTSVAAAG